jgi:tetratricopeptide (TPR) repeat protein
MVPAVTCPEPAQLEQLFRGQLAPAERSSLEQHLDVCEPCAALVSALARLFASASWGASEASSPPSLHAPEPEPEPTLGRYRVRGRLGAGAMGLVLDAYDPELERHVAIKLLHGAAEAAGIEQTLLDEARAMARLAHPHVVAVYDVGRVGEQRFVAMERVEGPTLRAWLAASARTQAEILAAFVGAGRGLAAAHAVGLVHRDFKPDNVLMDRDGRARVTDFGLAAARLGVSPPASPRERDATATLRLVDTSAATSAGAGTHASGMLVGTPAYMAPEQWLGRQADARSDQFAFCVALHEALLGRRPFAGETLAELRASVLAGRRVVVPPRGVPRWLLALLDRGLSIDPARRHADMTALLGELERVRRGPGRHPLVVASFGLAALLGGGIVMVNARSRAPADPDALPTSDAGAHEHEHACREALVGVGGRWTATRRAGVVAQQGEPLARAIDAWAERWTSAALERCAGPRAPQQAARDRCIDLAALDLDALLVVLGDPEAAPRATMVALAWSLPRLDDCVSGLVAPPAVPPEPRRAEVDALARVLADAAALLSLGRATAAHESSDAALSRAESLGDAPSLARAWLSSARFALWLEDDPDAAVRMFERAAELAAGVHEAVERDAALAAMTERGARWLDRGAAARWRRVVLAQVQGEGGDPVARERLAAHLALAEVRIALAEGELIGASERLAAIEPTLATIDPADPLRVALGLARVEVELALGQGEAARTRASALSELATREHAGTLLHGEALLVHARACWATGELARAAELADAAIDVAPLGRSPRHDRAHTEALGLSGRLALARGDTHEAAARIARAEGLVISMPDGAWPLLWRFELALREGQIGAARQAITAAIDRLDVLAHDDARRLPLLEFAARVLLDAARVLYEAAIALVDAKLGACPRRAMLQRELGTLEVRAGRPTDALAQLDAAHVMLAAGLGQHHPTLVHSSLARADLAWQLDRHDDALPLYRVVARELEALGEVEAAARAKQRASSDAGPLSE